MIKSDTVRQRRSLIILMVTLLIFFLVLMRPFLKSMILAGIITILFSPVYRRVRTALERCLLRKSGGYWLNPAHIASLISTLVVLFMLVLPSVWVVTETIDQIRQLITSLNLQENITQLLTTENYNLYVQPYLDRLASEYAITLNLAKSAGDAARWLTEVISQTFPQIFLGTAGIIFDFFIMMVGIYFLFIEGPRLLRLAFDLSPLSVAHEKRLSRQFKNVIDATVLGYLVTSLVQAILSALIFKFSGLTSWVVLGAMTFFMSMVPIVGAAGVWVPVSLWFLLTGEYATGIVNIICGAVIISGIDNFLKPVIIQGRTQIHPLLVFFSLFGGITFFGPLGILFGPVITSLFIASVKIYREEYI